VAAKQEQSAREPANMRPVDFADPPVVETAIGVVFAPMKSWNLLHFGLLWERFRRTYPNAEVKLPTGKPQFEGLDFTSGAEIELSKLPLRCAFLDSARNQSVQVQSNSFVRNWRKTDEPVRYVHYDEIRPLFVQDWSTFKAFLIEHGFQAPEIWQAEVTYVNHIVRGREWDSLMDVANIFPFWERRLTSRFDFRPYSFSFTAALPENRGQLNVLCSPVLRADGRQVIQLTISSCGKPSGSDDKQLMAWIDQCHEYVVTFFADFTSEKAQTAWRRTK
jgi:uncharacterized protein (TIGR04255 family)